MRASSSRMTVSVSRGRGRRRRRWPRSRTSPAPSRLRSGAAGTGVSSWMGHRSGETTSSGVVGCPSRMVSRKPCTAGPKARSRIRSVLTRLMPILTLIRSAGVSRMARAVKGSSRALPPKPRLTSSTPPADAASAGQVVVGLSAFEPWLIELPWCSHTRRPRSGDGLDRGVGAQRDQLGDLVVRQPDLDVLRLRGQAVEADRADRARPGDHGPGGHVHGAHVAAGRRWPARRDGRRRAGRRPRRDGAGRRRRPSWSAARPARRPWRGCGTPGARRTAGPRPSRAGRRGSARGPRRAAGAAAPRARCARGRRHHAGRGP